MRIALLQPCYWPEVRRGTERLVHDLGIVLVRLGHDVSLITSHSGPSRTSVEDGVRVVRSRRPPRFSPMRRYEDHLDSVPTAIAHLLRGRYDVAHAFHPAYAWAAAKAHRLGGPPYAFSFHGIPVRRYLVERRYRLEVLRAAIGGASAVTVLSEQAAEAFRRYLLVEPRILPGGLFTSDFAVEAARHEPPTLLCAASLGDPRKRADLLFRAFTALRERADQVTLRLVRTSDPFMSPRDLRLPDGAQWVDGDSTQQLAREYASAHASVLPSVGEAFGLVVLESLAAGTPVVGVRQGASAGLLSDDETGALFDTDDEASLVDAFARALKLGGRDETLAACRAAAEAYDWGVLAGPHEGLYRDVIRAGR